MKNTLYPTQRGEKLSTAAILHLETVLQPRINAILKRRKKAQAEKVRALEKVIKEKKRTIHQLRMKQKVKT